MYGVSESILDGGLSNTPLKPPPDSPLEGPIFFGNKVCKARSKFPPMGTGFAVLFLDYVVPTKRGGQPGRKAENSGAQWHLSNNSKINRGRSNMQEIQAVFPDFLKRNNSLGSEGRS